MELSKITLEFTSEEIEAIHYTLEIGIRQYRKDKCNTATDWINKADEIRSYLPIKLKFKG